MIQKIKEYIYELIEKGRYKILLTKHKLVKRGDLVFDLGSSKGDYTKVFLELGANVISIDPNPVNSEILLKRFKHNSSVNVLNVGVSNMEGKFPFYVAERKDNSSFSKLFVQENNIKVMKTIPIKTLTLKELIKKYGVPDFIKIDVEGYEYEVLQGISSEDFKALSFENFADKESFFRIMNIFRDMKDLEFNYSSGSFEDELHKMHLSEWVSNEELIKSFMPCFDIPDFNCDIYVRRKIK